VEILLFAPYPPYPPRFGGATRVCHLVRAVAREHRITLLCFASPEESAALGPLREVCEAVHTVPYPTGADPRAKRFYQLRSLVGRPYSYYVNYSPAMAAALQRLSTAGRFDLVQLEFGDVAPFYAVPGPALRVLDEHNVEHRLLERSWRQARSPFRRLYNRIEAHKLRRAELATCRRMDAILTTSDVDRATLAPDVDGVPIRVIPNGVDTAFFTPDESTPVDPARLVFTGAIDYHPNTDGVLHFSAEILPRIRAAAPDVNLAVVGKDPPPAVQALAGERVLVTGTVPDVRPWLRSAAVVVVPLRVGGGTRLKILEALATGRAVVSTSLGCEGLEVTPGEDILVADTPEAFAEAVVRCLREPALRARLGAAGRALVERRYRWETIGRSLSDFYWELSARGAGSARRRGVAA
jgi:sugar transferase (PEP-CTERM/EpsH1 system associated)